MNGPPSNLHKLSVKDYHESFQNQRRLSSASAGAAPIGQLISENNEKIWQISALGSKKWWSRQNKGTFI